MICHDNQRFVYTSSLAPLSHHNHLIKPHHRMFYSQCPSSWMWLEITHIQAVWCYLTSYTQALCVEHSCFCFPPVLGTLSLLDSYFYFLLSPPTANPLVPPPPDGGLASNFPKEIEAAWRECPRALSAYLHLSPYTGICYHWCDASSLTQVNPCLHLGTSSHPFLPVSLRGPSSSPHPLCIISLLSVRSFSSSCLPS